MIEVSMKINRDLYTYGDGIYCKIPSGLYRAKFVNISPGIGLGWKLNEVYYVDAILPIKSKHFEIVGNLDEFVQVVYAELHRQLCESTNTEEQNKLKEDLKFFKLYYQAKFNGAK
jgi:hypothetical protein